ncbi:MAG: hypothetical protein M1818_002259 [Claussenomyces sp. TS43310]|nr:MAG: hypothetical protein M1818_002259 [Claussenomyces sp. TS43310]
MASISYTEDYYAILEVLQTATSEEIRKSYRRLARIKHPDKNGNIQSATVAFQTLVRAYETLNDATTRSNYDVYWSSIKDRQRAEEEYATREKHTQRVRELNGDIFEVIGEITKIIANLEQLETLDDVWLRKERERKSWWTYVTSLVLGGPEVTDEERGSEAAEHVQRIAVKRIEEWELRTKVMRLETLELVSGNVSRRLQTDKQKEDETRLEGASKEELRRKRKKARLDQLRESIARWDRKMAARAAA